MLRLTLLSIAILIIQGCTTFKTGDFRIPKIDNNSDKEHLLPSKELPIIVQYYINIGMDNETDMKWTKIAVLKSIANALDNHNVKFQDTYDTLPDEYIHVHVIQDMPHDMREGDYNALRLLSVLFSAITLTVIPTVDADIENYIKISHVKNKIIKKNQVYIQDNRRYISLLFLPLAPLFTLNDSLSDTIETSISEYFQDET
jgi:hypothetical protein